MNVYENESSIKRLGILYESFITNFTRKSKINLFRKNICSKISWDRWNDEFLVKVVTNNWNVRAVEFAVNAADDLSPRL